MYILPALPLIGFYLFLLIELLGYY